MPRKEVISHLTPSIPLFLAGRHPVCIVLSMPMAERVQRERGNLGAGDGLLWVFGKPELDTFSGNFAPGLEGRRLEGSTLRRGPDVSRNGLLVGLCVTGF